MEILVVEDNDVLRSAICYQLKSLGLTTHEARDGKEAIAHARLDCCNLILMDVMMPEVTGLEATRIIKQDANKLTIVVMTAGETTREEAIQAGADDFIAKPILRQHLDYVVSQYGDRIKVS